MENQTEWMDQELEIFILLRNENIFNITKTKGYFYWHHFPFIVRPEIEEEK